MKNILLTGGSGLLGTELRKYLDCYAPSHKVLDITQPNQDIFDGVDMIVHAAAYTDVAGAEKNRFECFNTNVMGTLNLLEMNRGKPFVYISTEYVYEPTCFYTRTKVEAEKMVYKFFPHLIIRTLFKPRPFPHEKAFVDQYTKGDYVDIIAPMIVGEIMRWDGKLSHVVDIGTGKKTMFELARQSRPDVKPCLVEDIKEVQLPKGIHLPQDNKVWMPTGRL